MPLNSFVPSSSSSSSEGPPPPPSADDLPTAPERRRKKYEETKAARTETHGNSIVNINTTKFTWDLRPDVIPTNPPEASKDCTEFLANPVVAIVVFVIGFCLILYGAKSIYDHMKDPTPKNLNRLWWQSSVMMAAITILGFMLPYRFRFGYNIYGVLFVLLLIEYAVLAMCFPINHPTAEQMETINEFVAERASKTERSRNDEI